MLHELASQLQQMLTCQAPFVGGHRCGPAALHYWRGQKHQIQSLIVANLLLNLGDRLFCEEIFSP